VNIRLCVAALLLLPQAALAQGNPGPFGGLFGRTPERIGVEFTSVEFRTAVDGQYDDVVFAGETVPADDLPKSGYTAGVNAGLSFQRQSDRLMFRTQAGATYQEFYRAPVFGATTYNGLVAVSGRVTTRLRLEGQARAMRSPFYRLVPSFQVAGPAVAIPGDPFIVRMLVNDSYDVTGGFVSNYAKHSSLSASVSQREMRFDGGRGNNFDAFMVQGHWKRQLNRSLALRAGYGRERILQSAFPDAEYVHEMIDLGVDFARQLSVAPRTSIGFATQTSVVKRPITGRRYRLNGRVSLSKYFGRTGHATASASRNTEFLPLLLEPLNSDAVHASLGGMPSKRTEWQNNASFGLGRFGFENTERFLTTHFTSRLSFALTQKFGLYGQYTLYYFKLPPTQTGVPLLGQVSRQAFTVGISTWIPIVYKVRTPRDPE
jgi:hypothetical protein